MRGTVCTPTFCNDTSTSRTRVLRAEKAEDVHEHFHRQITEMLSSYDFTDERIEASTCTGAHAR
jgi:hypothetical protein